MTRSQTASGQIVSPPRSSLPGAALLVLLIIILALSQFLPMAGRIWLFRITLLAMPVAIASRSIYTVHFCLFLVCYWLGDWFPHFSNPTFGKLTFLVLYAFAVVCIPALRDSVGWLHPGKSNRTVRALSLATIVLASIALVAWVHYLNPDLHGYAKVLPSLPPVLMILFGIGFSAFNAAAEEIMWRGVMLEALNSAFGPGFWPLAIQAASFGIAHYKGGFPSGIVGVCMVFVYGLVLGAIRVLSKGMLYCWLIHVAADSTIFSLIYIFMHSSK